MNQFCYASPKINVAKKQPIDFENYTSPKEFAPKNPNGLKKILFKGKF